MAETLVVPRSTIPGTLEYLQTTLSCAKRCLRLMDRDVEPFLKHFRELEKAGLDGWSKLGYWSLDELVKHEFESTIDSILELERGYFVFRQSSKTGPCPKASAVTAAIENPMGKHGNGPGRGHKRGANSTSFPHGSTQATYLARRIARDNPAIFKRLEAGEYRSVRAAAIEAGIVKVPTPLEVAKKAILKLSKPEQTELTTWIKAL